MTNLPYETTKHTDVRGKTYYTVTRGVDYDGYPVKCASYATKGACTRWINKAKKHAAERAALAAAAPVRTMAEILADFSL